MGTSTLPPPLLHLGPHVWCVPSRPSTRTAGSVIVILRILRGYMETTFITTQLGDSSGGTLTSHWPRTAPAGGLATSEPGASQPPPWLSFGSCFSLCSCHNPATITRCPWTRARSKFRATFARTPARTAHSFVFVAYSPLYKGLSYDTSWSPYSPLRHTAREILATVLPLPEPSGFSTLTLFLCTAIAIPGAF